MAVDIDGDGRTDRAVLLAGWRYPSGGWGDSLVIRLATGRTVHAELLDQGSYRYPYSDMLGRADVNGDGRDEVVLLTGGNTAHFGAIATIVRHRLRVAEAPPQRGSTPSPMTFYGHGNSCSPWCDLSTRCQLVRGQPRIVADWGEGRPQTWRIGHEPKHYTRHWHVGVYKLNGARFVLTQRHHGVTPSDQPLPEQWPFINSVSCGTAHWPQ